MAWPGAHLTDQSAVRERSAGGRRHELAEFLAHLIHGSKDAMVKGKTYGFKMTRDLMGSLTHDGRRAQSTLTVLTLTVLCLPLRFHPTADSMVSLNPATSPAQGPFPAAPFPEPNFKAQQSVPLRPELPVSQAMGRSRVRTVSIPWGGHGILVHYQHQQHKPS